MRPIFKKSTFNAFWTVQVNPFVISSVLEFLPKVCRNVHVRSCFRLSLLNILDMWFWFRIFSKKFCPNGCPCPEYECPGYVKDWIFAMITWKEEQSVILDGYNQYKQPSFTYSTDTEVEHSCSIVWNNQMYVFGGLSKVNQISKVENCHLNLVGQLNFRMHKGSVIHNCKKNHFQNHFQHTVICLY